MSELPEWPKPLHIPAGLTASGIYNLGMDYERARADAAMARLRVAVEALAVLRPALWLDLRYASDDDDKDALLSRARGVDEALIAIDMNGAP